MFTTIDFTYDSYEKGLGDGYYPQLKYCDACTTPSSHSFKLVWVQINRPTSGIFWLPTVFDTWEEVEKFQSDNEDEAFVRVWKQMDGDSISGLDGNCGVDLFELLNEDTATGIVNLNSKFIYRRVQRPPPINVEKTPTVKAREIIRYHAAMPYVLGGSVAKYQGIDETLKYLRSDHAGVFDLISQEEINEIIRSTIEEERT
jgi:hypothetical protein